MNCSISVQDKKSFIQWFLERYTLKSCGSKWILEYLLTDETVLSNTHFVRGVKCCPRGIIMSTTCSNEIAFQFHKEHIVTIDVDKSFHDLRLHKQKPMYIQINFYNAYQNPYYIAVLEDNPYIPEDIALKKQDQVVVNQLLEKSLEDFKRDRLKKKIDQSLDENNQEAFFQYVNELKQLKE